MKLVNLKVAVRLSLAFGVILFFLAGIAYIGWSALSSTKARLDLITTQNNAETMYANKIRKDLDIVARSIYSYILYKDADTRQQMMKRIVDVRKDMDDEVRNLAQRSASAAREVKALIGTSVEKIDIGTRLVDQAGASMQEIVESVRRVTDIMRDITVAGQEQTAGIEQINTAVAQMDHVTQQNAALVEETASTAESMRNQATHLAQLVSVFKLVPAPAKNLDADRKSSRKIHLLSSAIR
jgi:hypothetical protein